MLAPFVILSHQIYAPAPLQDRLQALVMANVTPETDYGIVVLDKSGKVLYQHAADEMLRPASSLKILTHIYAFSKLGADYRPSTLFWKDGLDLLVDAPGDPFLSSDQLKTVHDQLALTEHYRLKVHGRFAGGYPQGWTDDDRQHSYGTAIYPFMVDKALVPVYASNQSLLPVPSYSQVLLKRGSDVGVLSTKYSFWARILSVQGQLPLAKTKLVDVPAPDPTATASGSIGGTLDQLDVVPSRAPDATVSGKTLAEMADLCLKPSDNMVAEHILMLAAETECSPDELQRDSFQNAALKMQKFYWSKLGISPSELRTFDGSGLSRDDRTSAMVMAKGLDFAFEQNWYRFFSNALPHPGSGTLRSRLAGVPVAAKTGSLNGVSSLCGYVFPESENPLIFAVIGHSSTQSASVMRSFQDKFVRELALEPHETNFPEKPRLEKSLPDTGPAASLSNRLH